MNALKFALRPDQLDLVKKVLADIRSGKYETLLAACPGFGKTEVAIEVVSKLVAEGKRVLVLAHATTVLRTNFVDRLGRRRPDLLEHPNVAVHIPQEHRRIVGRFDLVVVDEAHEFYEVENGLVERLVKKVGAQQVLLLTGTPFCFTRRGLSGHYVSLQELHEMGRAADLRVELATAAFKLREEDWNSDQETRTSVSFSSSATARTMEGILRAYPRLDWKSGKTLIYCRSRAMAKHVSSFLTARQIKHLASFHEDGDGGQRVEDFRQGKAPVLVVVRRGRLGFDMPALSTVIDLTMSRNPAVIFQMMCRLVRVPEGNGVPEKTFIKAMPRVFSGEHLRYFMSGVLELSRRDLYTSYVGKVWELPTAVVERKGNGYRGTGGGRAPRFEAGMMVFGDYFTITGAHAPGAERVGYAKMWDALQRRGRDPEKTKAELLGFVREHKRLPLRRGPEQALAEAKIRYCWEHSTSYDPEFKAALHALIPTRDQRRAARVLRQQAAVIAFISRFGRRPSQYAARSRPGIDGVPEYKLGRFRLRFTNPSSKDFDQAFRQRLEKICPADDLQSKRKRAVLDFIHRLRRRPLRTIRSEKKLALVMRRFCSPKNPHFDASFRDQIEASCPSKRNKAAFIQLLQSFLNQHGRRPSTTSHDSAERSIANRMYSRAAKDPDVRRLLDKTLKKN